MALKHITDLVFRVSSKLIKKPSPLGTAFFMSTRMNSPIHLKFAQKTFNEKV